VSARRPMVLIHASCVAVEGRGVLLRGAPGAGKSDLALRLIEGGADLVSDDQVVLTVSLDADGRISETGFEGEGCSISQASASMLAAHLGGQTIEEAEALVQTFKGIMQGEELTEEQEDTLGEIVALQGVREFPIRIKCALLGWTTLQDAIADYRKTHSS